MLVSALFSRVKDVCQDDFVRWTEAELLRWLSDGQREVVIHKPEASTLTGNVLLTGSTTRQNLPSGALSLIDVTRNMGSGGTTPGRAIRLTAREILDAQRPTWHSETGSEVRHFIYDARNPKAFFVYPAPNPAVYVEMVYCIEPGQRDTANGAITSGDITASTKYTSLDDLYVGALVDYVLYRAYSKDAEYAGNAQRAVAHYTAFANAIGIRTASEGSRNPNVHSPFNPLNPVQAKG
jgi:hypothetical protein